METSTPREGVRFPPALRPEIRPPGTLVAPTASSSRSSKRASCRRTDLGQHGARRPSVVASGRTVRESAPAVERHELSPCAWAERLLDRPAPRTELLVEPALVVGELRRIDRAARLLGIDAVQARRVQPEDLGFDRGR